MVPPRARALVFAGIAAAIGGCDDRAFINVPLDASAPPAYDGGSHNGDAGTSPSHPAVLREDFSTRELVETSSVAIVDVNRGVVALPAVPFPSVSDVRSLSYEQNVTVDGLIERAVIEVSPQAVIDATRDSIELRAKDRLIVSGLIRAGPGGVTLHAGKELTIAGIVESEGPITLRLAAEDGVLTVSGTLRTADADSTASAPIVIQARGAVALFGEILTGATSYGDSGAIEVTSYGPIDVHGGRIEAGSSDAGAGGKIRFATEQTISVAPGARIAGGASEALDRSPSPLAAGQVELLGAGLALSGQIAGGTSIGGLGGALRLVTSGALVADRTAELLGGAGRIGGAVSIEAQTSTVGPDVTIRGGDGDQEAGRVLLGTSGDLFLIGPATIRGGDGRCAVGADVVLQAAGTAIATGANLTIAGGAGGTEVGTGCFNGFAGGHVQIVAQDAIGPLAAASSGGTGTPAGSVNLQLDPRYVRPVPDIKSRTSGWVVSRVIDRGPAAAGFAPVLHDSAILTPRLTFAQIQLASADDDGAPPLWIDLLPEGAAAVDLAGARKIRYRVFLRGRALDTPEVDYFEVDLRSGP